MRVFMSVPMAVYIDARLAVLHRELDDYDLEPFSTGMLYEVGRGHLVPPTRSSPTSSSNMRPVCSDPSSTLTTYC